MSCIIENKEKKSNNKRRKHTGSNESERWGIKLKKKKVLKLRLILPYAENTPVSGTLTQLQHCKNLTRCATKLVDSWCAFIALKTLWLVKHIYFLSKMPKKSCFVLIYEGFAAAKTGLNGGKRRKWPECDRAARKAAPAQDMINMFNHWLGRRGAATHFSSYHH